MRRHLDLDRRILRITATDGKGAVVAATHKTLDYYQADEEYWQNIYAQGRGAISLTDILYDDVTKSNYIGVGVPVVEEASSQFIGTVDALVDVSTIFPLVNRIQFGPTARTMLVKDDGTVISAPNIELSMKLKSEEYEAVRDALGSLQGRQTGYLAAGMRSGTRLLIGFADTGLKQDYRNLGWVVMVRQEAREASAPLRVIGNFAYLMVVLGLLMVTLVAVYFFSHRNLFD